MRLLVPVLALAALSGCNPPCPEPSYEGKASDEAGRTMLDGEARATRDDAKAVTLLFPADGAQLSRATAPAFSWTTPLIASSTREPARSILSRLSELIYSSAWAHLPPVTGPVHLLRITVPGRACPIEVITTQLEWIPSSEVWAQLQAGGNQPLSLDVYSAYLQENRITEGPFHFSSPKTFSVGP